MAKIISKIGIREVKQKLITEKKPERKVKKMKKENISITESNGGVVSVHNSRDGQLSPEEMLIEARLRAAEVNSVFGSLLRSADDPVRVAQVEELIKEAKEK